MRTTYSSPLGGKPATMTPVPDRCGAADIRPEHTVNCISAPIIDKDSIRLWLSPASRQFWGHGRGQ